MEYSIKYFVTSVCQKQIDKEKFGPRITQMLQDLKRETRHDLVTPNKIGKQYIYKPSIKSAPRFVFFKEQRGSVKMFVLRKIYQSHDEYSKVINTYDFKTGRWYEQHCYSDKEKEEIEQEFKEMFTEHPDATKEYPRLSEAEYAFVNDKCHINQEIFDDSIYETAEWINMVQNGSFDDFDSVAEPLLDFILEKCYTNQYGTSEIDVKFKDGKQKIILTRIKNDEKSSKWVLRKIINQGEEYDDIKDEDLLLKNCRRAYPYSVLDNKDFWRNMEKDPNSNFILSDEEVGIIANENKYPLFISGRAGSGKSTVLQYLFAEKILQYSQYKDFGQLNPPVYLSYSKELVNTARDLSKSLFGKNHIYREELAKRSIKYEEDLETQLDGYFYEFKELIKKCIKEGNPTIFKHGQKFDEDKYVSFAQFRQLWTRHFGKIPEAVKKYNPTISWHIIRTYIKGWNSMSEITPDDYSEIGKDNQDVTEETFKMVYQKVWEEWYKPSGYWDDQDLVKYCLNPDDGHDSFVTDSFSAVFCDESQDFTRAEIDFILKLSSFSSRQYNNVNEINLLPFVFAGDEFQTLNPTGFSWDSLKGYFTECLSDITNFNKNEISPDDPVSLTKNYRSTAQIVKLGNRMQLLRESRFAQRSEPQDPYFSDEGSPVFCFSPSDTKVWDELKKNEVILIVPSSDGQTPKEYIQGTEIKDKITFYDNGVAENLTILNPIQAKGLEYSNVAVYGFNSKDYPELSIHGLLDWFDKFDANITDKDIDLQYQVNNAYVAITRAKKKLFIIDKFDANSFWSFAFSKADTPEIELLEQKMKNNLSDSRRKVWKDAKLGWIVEGSINDITGENTQDDSNIKKLAISGKEIGNSGMLLQAAARYKERGREKDASECMAWAYEYDSKFEKAAEYFIKAGNYEDAIRVYWTFLDKEKKVNTIKSISQIEFDSVKVELCKQLQNNEISALDIVVSLLKIRDNNENAFYNAWTCVIELLLKKVNTTNITDNDFTNIKKIYIDLRLLYGNSNDDLLIKIAYTTQRYNDVIELCDKFDKKELDEYREAKLKTLPYPDILSYYENTEEILSAYKNHKDTILNEQQKQIVGNAALKAENMDVLKQFLPFMLSIAENQEQFNIIIKASAKLNLNIDVLNTLSALKYDKLDNWRKPSKVYKDLYISYLFDIVELAQKYKTSEGYRVFKEDMAKKLKYSSNIITEFDREYGIYLDNPYLSILLFTLGLQMEKRGLYKDSVPFYRWAIEKIGKLKKENVKAKQGLEKRWIVCKEEFHRLKPDVDLQDTKDKRKELGLDMDEPLPEHTDINDICDWELLFNQACSESVELFKTEDDKKSEEVVVQPMAKPEPRTNGNSAGKQTVQLGDYVFKFNPQKRELSINLEEEDLRIKIKNGIIPENDEFVVATNGCLIKAEDNSSTPFVIEKDGNRIIVKVFDNEIFTGITLCFDFT